MSNPTELQAFAAIARQDAIDYRAWASEAKTDERRAEYLRKADDRESYVEFYERQAAWAERFSEWMNAPVPQLEAAE